MNENTKKLILVMKEHGFLDLSFLFEEPEPKQIYFESYVRKLHEKADYLLSFYLQNKFSKFLLESSFSYADVLNDIECVKRKHDSLNAIKKALNEYHSNSGASDAEAMIKKMVHTLHESEVSNSVFVNAPIWEYVTSSDAFLSKSVTLKLVGEVEPIPTLSRNFDKLVYVFKNVDTAIEFVYQAQPGTYTIAIHDEDKPSDSHFVLGIKFENKGGVVISDGNYNPNKKSRSNRTDVERMEKSFFPYSLLNLNHDDLYFYPTESKSTELDNIEGFKHEDFLGYRELKMMSENDAIKLSVLFNQIIAMEWSQYIASFTEASGRPNIHVHEDSSQSHIKSDDSNSVLLPKVATRESFLDALKLKVRNETGDDSRVRNTEANSYWESQFPSDLKSVVIGESNLLENKSVAKNTVLVAIHDSDSMMSAHDIAITTVKEARKNQADKLKVSINDYFERNVNAMRTWISNEASKEEVFNSILKKAINFEEMDYESKPSSPNLRLYTSRLAIECGSRIHAFSHNGFNVSSGGISVPDKAKVKDESFTCVVNGCKAKYNFIYQFNDAYDIAFMLGVSMDKLPYHLSQYGIKYYTGNSILDDIDPVESMSHEFQASNKYTNILGIALPFSLSGLNSARKEFGLEKLSAEKMKEIASSKKFKLF